MPHDDTRRKDHTFPRSLHSLSITSQHSLVLTGPSRILNYQLRFLPRKKSFDDTEKVRVSKEASRMCCLIPDTPIEDTRGRIKTFPQNPYAFQTDMMNAPCAGGLSTCCWCLGQFFPITMGCTQYALRKKVLKQDMTRYVCCQGTECQYFLI